MYCSYCGKKIDEAKIEKKQASKNIVDEEVELDENSEVVYVCPRCSHRVHHDLTEEEYKSLSRASHSEIQTGNNYFAIGMGNICIGAICLIIGVIFFLLAHKPANQYLLSTTCTEFYVAIVLFIVGFILVVVGAVYVVLVLLKKLRIYHQLIDINNKTFIQ